MFGKEKIRPPDTEFIHGHDCKILRADPSTSIPWSEIERGCGSAAVCAAPSIGASRCPRIAGRTRSTLAPSGTLGSVSSATRQIPR
jgi:hypothetical protein